MSDQRHCTTCGKPLASDAPEGLCPACLFQRGLESRTFDPQQSEPAAAGLPPPSPEELAPYFPQLEIISCLGRGGMGVVYQARQKSLDRLVALKILAPEREKDPAFAERFAREALALARLNHPHIVTIHDFGEAGPYFFLLMEFVDGVNLRQLLQTRQLEPREALAIVPPICEALQFAHDHGIVHRDIKPANLLLDKQGRVKIADFGIATMLDGPASQPDERAAGTPGYVAPEQLFRPQTVDHRADIYSLGVVLYEMLTGELPAKSIEPPSHKVHIDVRLDEVVLRALERDPELRYSQASLIKTQIEEIAMTPAGDAAPQPLPPWAAWMITWPIGVRRWWCRGLVLVGVLSTAIFMAPSYHVEQLPGTNHWQAIWAFGLTNPWLLQVTQLNPHQSCDAFQPRSISFLFGIIAGGVWIAFWLSAAAERLAGKRLTAVQQVFAPRPIPGPDGRQRFDWKRVVPLCAVLLASTVGLFGLVAAAMLVVFGAAPSLVPTVMMSALPMLTLGMFQIVRWGMPVQPAVRAPGRVGAARIIFFVACGWAMVLAAIFLMMVTRMNDDPLPDTDDVRSIEANFYDREQNAKVAFQVPRDHWNAIFSALLPAQKDSNPAKWVGLGELTLSLTNGDSWVVTLYDVTDESGAFSAGPTWEQRVYYRGGRSADLQSALVEAYKSSKPDKD